MGAQVKDARKKAKLDVDDFRSNDWLLTYSAVMLLAELEKAIDQGSSIRKHRSGAAYDKQVPKHHSTPTPTERARGKAGTKNSDLLLNQMSDTIRRIRERSADLSEIPEEPFTPYDHRRLRERTNSTSGLNDSIDGQVRQYILGEDIPITNGRGERQAEIPRGGEAQTIKVVVPQTRRQMDENMMVQLMPPPGDQNLITWMAKAMFYIPHGSGNTTIDRILMNALQRKLRESGRKDDATLLGEEFSVKDPNWRDITQRLELLNPVGELKNSVIIDTFNRNYKWKLDKPMQILSSCLRKMNVGDDTTPMMNPDGRRLFQIMRTKLPEGLRAKMQGKEKRLWKTILRELQEYWNMTKADEDVATPANANSFGYVSSRLEAATADKTIDTPPEVTPIAPVYVTNVYPNTTEAPMPRPTQAIPLPGVQGGQNTEVRRNPPRAARRILTRPDPALYATQPQRYRGRLTNNASTSASQPNPRQNNGQRRGPRFENQRQNRSVNTPSTIEEANDIAARDPRYDFWTNPYIFQDFGLYVPPNMEQLDSRTTGSRFCVCYTCLTPGHRSSDCLVNAMLRIAGEVIKKDENGEYYIGHRMRPVNDRQKEVDDQYWKPFLEGKNPLQITLKTVAQLDDYLHRKSSPGLLQRRRLADQYYGERPTISAADKPYLFKPPVYQPRQANNNARLPQALNANAASFWHAKSLGQGYNRAKNF